MLVFSVPVVLVHQGICLLLPNLTILYWHHISWNEFLFVWQALDYIWRNCLRK